MREPRLRVLDAIEHLERVVRLTAGLEFEEFVANEAIYQAVLYSLGIIGEAAKNIPADVRDQSPETEWRNIMRLRDLVFHVYFGISDETVYRITQDFVPDTLAQLHSLAKKLEG